MTVVTFAADILDEEVRALGIKILNGVVLGTPVDTGRARGNWVVTFNAPETQIQGRRDTVGSATIQAGQGKLGQLRGEPLPSSIYLTNNLPYIERLNEGHSKQAPSKYVDSAIQRALNSG